MNWKKYKGAMILVFVAFIWGNGFVAQSIGMDYMEPFGFNGIRMLFGAIVLLPVIAWMQKKQPQRKEGTVSRKRLYIPGGIACGICLFAGSSLQQVGIQYTSAGKAGFLTALYIVLVPVLGIFLKKRAGLKVWCSVGIAALGAYLLSVKDGFSIAGADILLILCGLAYAVHILVIDYFAPQTDGVKMSCIQFFVCAVLSLCVSGVTESVNVLQIQQCVIPLLYAGVLSCGVAYTLQIIGQKGTDPTVASLVMSLESVFSALGGWLILKETLSARELTGCVLVFAAVLLAQIPEKKGRDIEQTQLES